MAMLALQPESSENERQAILTALNNNPSIESYIFDNLESSIE